MRSKTIGILSTLVIGVLMAGVAAAQAPSKEPAPASGLKTGPATVAPHWSKNKYPETIPEGASYHIVEKGDTLWDISARYLKSPYLWPQVWDQNRYITDAHWIYPGDPIILPQVALVAAGAGAGGGAEGMGPDDGLPGEGPDGATGTALFPVTEEATLQCAPYITRESEDNSLRIFGSEFGNDKVAFSDRDILYLNKGSNAGVKAGDVYTIHRVAYKVKHPVTKRTVGTKVEIDGWVRVILVQENSATAVVEQACSDINAGSYLKPYEKVSVPLVGRRLPADRLTPPTGKAAGYVIDVDLDRATAATGHMIALDLGAQDGISPGNILTVYRKMYPSMDVARNVVGEVAILAVREQTALGKVTYSNDAILPGDAVELR